MDTKVVAALMEDVVKLDKARKLLLEVFENYKDLTGSSLGTWLHQAIRDVTNVENTLKIILDPDAPVSVSIPFRHDSPIDEAFPDVDSDITN